jgi:hypothetical protein
MSEAFAREVARVAVAQICQSLGYNSLHQTPLETLVDLLQRCKLEQLYILLFY